MPRRKQPAFEGLPGSPFLTDLSLGPPPEGGHPFDLPVLRRGLSLPFETPVTFFVGENGSGKSTLLEAIAWNTGFSDQGGDRGHVYGECADGRKLGGALRLAWRQKVAGGFFLRAETFFNFATYLEDRGSTFHAYGGKSLHDQSHGEAFLALFHHRFEDGLYLLDEPEAALSPQRQLAFLAQIHELVAPKAAQFIIATHSPILLAFPGATIWSFDGGEIHRVRYEETDHYRLTKDFLDAPERFFRHLFHSEDED